MSGLPTPPVGFGSYDPDDVTFLLTDLSDRALETDLEAREAHVRSGGHYSEYLPIEYEPTPAYHALFEDALARYTPYPPALRPAGCGSAAVVCGAARHALDDLGASGLIALAERRESIRTK